MAAKNYPTPCLDKILVYEGGYSNHPSDPGGVTLEGVIQVRYNEYRQSKGLPKKALTKGMRYAPEWIRERNEIYKRHYWDAVKGDQLRSGEDLAVFDFGVNSGPARSLKYWKAAYDPSSAVNTIKKLCKARLSFLHNLKTWKVFGGGWGKRVANVEATAVKMALAETKAPEVVKKDLEVEAKKASTKSTQHGSGATGTVATGGTTQVPDAPHSFDFSSLDFTHRTGVIVAGIAVTALAIWFIWHWWHNRQRAEAYRAAANA